MWPRRGSRFPELRALLVRAGALGDLLLLRRSIYALRRAGHSVTLLAPSGPAEALVGSGPAEVGRVAPWGGAAVASLFSDEQGSAAAFPEALTGFDVTVAYTLNAALVRNLRAGVRVLSYDPTPPTDGRCHASEWLSRPLGELGVPAALEPPTCVPTDNEEHDVRPLLGRLGDHFLALHPGSGSPRKNWPVGRFGQIATRLAAGRPWLLVQGPADEGSARTLERLAGAVVAKDLPVRTLGALLAHAGAYVGNDSGVSHLAAAWGAPTVALFGPTDPAVWSPVGSRVVTLRSEDGTLESLAADRVEDAVRSVAPGFR